MATKVWSAFLSIPETYLNEMCNDGDKPAHCMLACFEAIC